MNDHYIKVVERFFTIGCRQQVPAVTGNPSLQLFTLYENTDVSLQIFIVFAFTQISLTSRRTSEFL